MELDFGCSDCGLDLVLFFVGRDSSASWCIYIYLADVGDIRVLNFSCKDPLRDTSCMNIPTSLELIFGRDTIE